MEKFCSITMKLPLFRLKLKPFPLVYLRDHLIHAQVSQVNTLCNHR